MRYYSLVVFSSVLLIVHGYEIIVFPCTTPNSEPAFCRSLYSCPVLLKALGTLDPLAIKFVKRSTCYGTAAGDLKVCCGTLGHFAGYDYVTPWAANASSTTTKPEDATTMKIAVTSPGHGSSTTTRPEAVTATKVNVTSPGNTSSTTTKLEDATTMKINLTSAKPTEAPNQQSLNSTAQESRRDFVKRRLLPTRKYCGLQHTDDRFYNSSTTALDEFPWLVDLPFLDDEDEDPDQFRDRCNGVLISNRYVLTIGTCANYLSKVRLGQYHTNATVSCIQNPAYPECTEPKYFAEVEEEIHRTNGSIAQHDFALLRLKERVSYSDFVRPICLPFHEPGDPEKRDSLVLTGWGALEENQQVRKKRLTYNVSADVDQCFKLDKDGLKEAASNVTVACLVPKEENGELACTGDEGSPLIYSHRFQWFVEALVTRVYDEFDESKVTGAALLSNFTDSCSNRLPISAIKITPDILDWIMDNMRR